MARSRSRAPRLLQLETLGDRVVPAVGLSTVNDNWAVVTDVGTPGLSAGDTVRNDNDTVAPGTVVGVLGTDAFTSINEAVANTVAFGTVRVLEGSYSENVVINVSNLTVVSVGGRDLTTITGTSNGALGAVRIAGGTNNVTFGGTGTGFTVNGIDNPSAGLESAAVYFQGNQTGTTIRGNRIVANGDSAITSEFGATVSNLTIDGNLIAGTTFTGTPAGDGTGTQFTLPNVPRQLVVLGGGSGGGNTSNVTFTNNTITGIAGGISTTDNNGNPVAAHEQGNNLVTIDSVGATITGNAFAGTTTRFGVALRARGPSTTISGNTFSSAGLTPTTGHVFVQNNQTLDAVAAANTFDKYAYVSAATGTIGVDLQTAVNAVPVGTTVNVLGTFTGPVTVNKAITVNGNFGATGAVTVTDPGAVIDGAVTAGAGLSLVSGSQLVVDLDSPTAFDQSVVTGAVDLGGATLTLNANFAPAPGASFTIVANDGSDAVVGTFAGLAEGDTITVGATTFVISYVGGDGNDVTLTVPLPPVVVPPPVTPPVTTAVERFAVSAAGEVRTYDAAGNLVLNFRPFAGYTGAVSVATGDVTGDGVEDVIVGAGAGAPGGHVKVFDGASGAEVRSFFAFAGFTGGVTVAAGDVTGDTVADVIVGAGAGAPGGHVKAFDGTTGAEVRSFFAFDAGYTGGVSVGAGDVTGDTRDDIIVGAAAGTTGGHVKVFDGATGAEVRSFFAFDAGFTGGVNVGAGDLDADGFSEILVGAKVGAGHVKAFDGETTALTQSFFADSTANGASVATADANNDGALDILAGTGTRARAFSAETLAVVLDLGPFDATSGVFVG